MQVAEIIFKMIIHKYQKIEDLDLKANRDNLGKKNEEGLSRE